MILLYFGILFLVIFWLLLLYSRWNHGKLENLGIPLIKPSLFLGSTPDAHKRVMHLEDIKRREKFGNLWATYEGRHPTIFITDPEIIRLIMVKDFDHFENRRFFDIDNIIAESMDLIRGEKWKVVRSLVSPTFTSGRMRVMSQQMSTCVEEFMNEIRTQFGPECRQRPFDVKKIFSGLTMDIIARCTYGTSINSIKNPENEFVTNARKLVGGELEQNFIFTLAGSFDFLFKILPIFEIKVINYFENTIKSILAQRKAANVQNKDFLDLMQELIDRVDGDEEFSRLGITRETFIAQAIVFIFAGYDSSSITLSMLLLYLAKYPEKQTKLRSEVDMISKKFQGKFDNESIGEMPYLSACIMEILRIQSPFVRIERVCSKEWKHEKLVIPKDVHVMIPIYAVHYDPDLWPNPSEFIPERYLSNEGQLIKNQGYNYLPFGNGPRGCIGIRFAVEQIKLTMCHLMRDFTFGETIPNTKIGYKNGTQFVIKFEHFFVNFKRR